MNVNATSPVVLFAVLMVGGLLACYLIGVHRGDVQAWIPYISDTGLRGPEHFVFAQLLNMAAFVGVVMILLRFITVTSPADNVCMKIVKILSLIIGSLATLFLSFVANFPEDQAHGVGLTHVVSAGILFTGGCVFIVIDALISLRMCVIEIRDDVTSDQSQQHWLRSLRCLYWLRLVVALLSIFALILAMTGEKLSSVALYAHRGNATVIVPHFWKPDEPGYALHVQGAVCEWLMGILFVVYSLLFLPEFRKFSIHVKLQPVEQNDNELAPPGERTVLL